MISKQVFLVACAAMVLSAGVANAGPCSNRAKDAGSGPTPGQSRHKPQIKAVDIKSDRERPDGINAAIRAALGSSRPALLESVMRKRSRQSQTS
jgi:hypothetical protein